MENKDMPASTNAIDWQSFDMAHGSNSTEEDAGQWVKYRGGLTKREHFIAMAMQGLCAKANLSEYEIIDIAYDAVKIADKTINQMEATENGTN